MGTAIPPEAITASSSRGVFGTVRELTQFLPRLESEARAQVGRDRAHVGEERFPRDAFL